MMLMKNQQSSKKLLEAWKKADSAALTSPDQAPQQAQPFADRKVCHLAQGTDRPVIMPALLCSYGLVW
jgi:hypothetical protein